MTKISNAGFSLLAELTQNNNRDWYNEHKVDFKDKVIEPFAAILETISERLMALDMDFRGGPRTVFRMNRDVRFSKDKTPYKNQYLWHVDPKRPQE